jgi:hypothetical protein
MVTRFDEFINTSASFFSSAGTVTRRPARTRGEAHKCHTALADGHGSMINVNQSFSYAADRHYPF